MGSFQQRQLRLSSLGLRQIFRYAALTIAVLCCLGTSDAAQPPHRRSPLQLAGLHSGSAVFDQRDRTTFLNLKIPPAPAVSIPLTHKGKYPQWTDGPWQSHLVAEVPGKFLVFTDTLASNPTNVQGPCGASPGGERYLHVVSLLPPVRETFSTIIESCWFDLVPKPSIPTFDPSTSTITVQFTPDHGDVTKSFRIASDNSVTPITP
jgi:hypothetical protein